MSWSSQEGPYFVLYLGYNMNINSEIQTLKNQYRTVKRLYEKQKLTRQNLILSSKSPLPTKIVDSFDRAILSYESQLFKLKNRIDALESEL